MYVYVCIYVCIHITDVCYFTENVDKGYIAVRNQLYRKIEVKGKGGGGKVYKVCACVYFGILYLCVRVYMCLFSYVIFLG